MKFLISLLGLFFLSWSPHKFYFSETLLEWKDPSSIQITIKAFSDDWTLATSSEHANDHDSLYKQYLQKHFVLYNIQNEKIHFQWLGHENEGEFVYLYLEITHQQKMNLMIQQSILTDLFVDQKNLVNYRNNGQTKSLYFFKDSSPQLLIWP